MQPQRILNIKTIWRKRNKARGTTPLHFKTYYKAAVTETV